MFIFYLYFTGWVVMIKGYRWGGFNVGLNDKAGGLARLLWWLWWWLVGWGFGWLVGWLAGWVCKNKMEIS